MTKYGEPRAFLDSFRDMPCEACGAQDGTIVPAHCNMERGGVGMKAWGCVAALCASCHSLVDGRVPATKEERLKVWVRVLQNRLRARYDDWMDENGK